MPMQSGELEAASGPSERLALRVLRGAGGTVALQSQRVVVERGDVGLAARQPGGHVAGLTVCTHAVVAVDVGGVRHRFLQGSHTHTCVLKRASKHTLNADF